MRDDLSQSLTFDLQIHYLIRVRCREEISGYPLEAD